MRDLSDSFMLVSYVISVLETGTGLVQRRKEMMLCGVLLGIFSLCGCLSASLPVCLPGAAALSRLPPTVCAVSLLLECPGALVPLALQWRMNGPDALWLGTPLQLCSARPPHQTCLRVSVFSRARVCVFGSVRKWVNECALGWQEWVIQQNQIQLLPAFLTADYCSCHASIKTNTAPLLLPLLSHCKAALFFL